MPTIEIRERGPIGSNTSAVNIGTVIAAAPHDARAGSWLALGWWAAGTGDRLDVLDLETKTEPGLSLSTAELVEIDRQLLQLIDGTIAAYGTVRPTSTDTDLRNTCRLVIQAIDSSFWRIYSRDPGALDGFRNLGGDVTDVKDRPMPASGSSYR